MYACARARWLRQEDYVAVSMERFTAAQGSGYGMGLGLEDSGGQASPSVNPARDFQVCACCTLHQLFLTCSMHQSLSSTVLRLL